MSRFAGNSDGTEKWVVTVKATDNYIVDGTREFFINHTFGGSLDPRYNYAPAFAELQVTVLDNDVAFVNVTTANNTDIEAFLLQEGGSGQTVSVFLK